MGALIEGRTAEAFVQAMIDDLFAAADAAALRAAADRWLTDDYAQTTDGRRVTRDEQLAHLEHLRAQVRSVGFDVQQAVYDGRWLAVRHLGRAELADGRVVDSEVATFFRLDGGRIAEAYELTRPISGDDADRTVHTAR